MKWLLAIGLLLVALPLSAQTTVTLNGTSYTLKGHPRTWIDGPGGVIDTGIKYNSGLAPKALVSNPAWEGMNTRAAFWMSGFTYNDENYQQYYTTGEIAAEFAMIWYSDNTQTAYHDAALAMLNNVDQYVSTLCNESQNGCYPQDSLGYSIGSYGAIYWFREWMLAYELMRGQMTTLQRQTFADKWLNDISAFGGINGSPGTTCTNPTADSAVSVTISGGVATAASALFGPGNPILAGYWISADTGDTWPAFIVSVTDSTHAVVSSSNANQGYNGYTGTLSYRRGNWAAGDCGILWAAKHGRYSPQSLSWVSGSTAYPGWGGNAADSTNNTVSWYQGPIAVFIALMDDDVNAASRGQVELTAAYNDFYTNKVLGYFEHVWTGFHLMGDTYGYERPWKAAMVNSILQLSISGSAPPTGGLWDKNLLYSPIMGWMPSCPSGVMQWGQGFGLESFGGYNDVTQISNAMSTYYIYHNTSEGGWFNWTLKNRLSKCTTFGTAPGGNPTYTNAGMAGSDFEISAQWIYAYTDPAFPSTDLTVNGPTAVALNQVDATTGTNYNESVLMSRTGYGSITDTLINFFGMGEWFEDHNLPSGGWYPGDYRIFKGNFMLAPDGINGTPYTNVSNNYNNGGQLSGYMEIGGAYNLLAAGTFPLTAKMPRAVTDGYNNRFAYAMADSSTAYVAGADVTRVHRHLIHFKEAQDFVMVFDDVALSGGKQIQTYLHYPNNFGASADSSRGATTLSSPNITSTYPGTGNSDATQLLTTVLLPGGANSSYIYTNNSNGTYTGGNGSTFRVSICASTTGSSCNASATAWQNVVVHEPVVGSGNTMPATTLLGTIDGNHVGVQIAGSNPKVGIFPKSGTTYTSATFTTTHTGTAQYVVTGLAAGTYAVTGGVTLSNQLVNPNGVLYWESTSGAFTIIQTSQNYTPAAPTKLGLLLANK